MDDRHRLLHGPYRLPPLKRGARATCLYRDCDVVITTWTDARVWRGAQPTRHRLSEGPAAEALGRATGSGPRRRTRNREPPMAWV